MQKTELLIFDLDDTLVDTSHVYWTARQQFIDVLEKHGVAAAMVLELFESFDARNISKWGFVPERYGYTMLETYEHLVEHHAVIRDEGLEQAVREAGLIVVNQLPTLIDGAMKLLAWSSKRFKTVLMTRGVEDLQLRKVTQAEIGTYFDEIRVVAQKDASHFHDMIASCGYSPALTWVIGDSIRSDINPALEAGANSILFVYTHHSYYWRQEYGVVPKGSFFKVDRLEDAISVLGSPDPTKKISPEQWAKSLPLAP